MFFVFVGDAGLEVVDLGLQGQTLLQLLVIEHLLLQRKPIVLNR